MLPLVMSQFEQDLGHLALVVPELYAERGFEGLFGDIDRNDCIFMKRRGKT